MTPLQKNRNFFISKYVSPERKSMIDQLVETVRKQINFEKPPLDLAHIESSIAEVQICEVANCPVSSEIFYLDPANRIAQINIRTKDLTPNKILCACHALGHYFLHPKEPFACRMDFFGETEIAEAEATYFAETLMMPDSLLKRMYEDLLGDYDPVYKLAKCFSVKRQIMEDRLASLQLL